MLFIQEEQLALCDYSERDPITGQYALYLLPLGEALAPLEA